MSGGEVSVWRRRRALIQLLGLASPWWRMALWTLIGLVAVLPAAFAVAVGVLVARVPGAIDDGLNSTAGRELWLALVGVAVVLVVERGAAPLLEVVRYRIGRDIDGALRDQLLVAVEDVPDLAAIESTKVQSQLALVKGGLFGTAGTAAVASAGVAGRYAQTLFALGVVAWFSPWLALVAGAVIVAIRRRWHRAFASLADGILDSADELRKVTYTAELVTTPPAVKEVRIFGLVDWLVDRCRGYWNDATAAPFEVRARLRRSANVELTLLGVSYGVTFVLAARAAAEGRIGIALLTAILQAQFSAAQLIAPTTDDFSVGPGTAALEATRAVQGRLRTQAQTMRTNSLPRPVRQPAAVVLDDVSFAYPGQDTPVLNRLNLELRAGESLALVGLNGAGKTTLVKLLCGLYVPTGGRILVDGQSLAEIDPVEWRKRVAAIFQDFNRYELTARDNVGVTHLATEPVLADVEAAASAAGAADFIAGLSHGWETILSRQYPGGAELSGGQWQRVALARALYAIRAGAGLLVLDEPTASLDIRAEAELFDRFLDWTAGSTSMLISHRFSTVRNAERIAVLHDGTIIEVGIHDQLLTHNGLYAELFHLQAQGFRNGAPDRDSEDADA